jgi:hypothetical protein
LSPAPFVIPVALAIEGLNFIFRLQFEIFLKSLTVIGTIAVEAVVVTLPKVATGPVTVWAFMFKVKPMNNIEIMVVINFIILFIKLLYFNYIKCFQFISIKKGERKINFPFSLKALFIV